MYMRDLSNQKFGKLTAIAPAGKQGKAILWRCVCECGNEKTVRGNNLTTGAVRSCGCMMKENNLKHGGSKTRLYRIWGGIIRRTEDCNRKEYADYGARGIRMCTEWRDDFAEFQRWSLENGYTDSLSIDRIDPDGNYCPENCRWSGKLQQENNKRVNLILTVNGESKTAAEWATISGIPAYQIRKRKRHGWSDEKAVFEPLNVNYQRYSK